MFKLFDYQRKLVDETRRKLGEGNRGVMVVSPPGSGKSVVIAEIARLATLKGNRVMFFVHRRELVKQITDSFKAQDVDLSKCTIMTVRKIANRLETLPKPSLIIVDESHHSRAKTYRKIFDYYSDVPRLGFTGSPWRMSGKGFQDIYSAMVEGPTVSWLIEHQKLAPFTEYGYKLGDSSQLKVGSNGDYTHQSMDKFAKTVIRGQVVKTWQKKANGLKTIVYCHSIDFAHKVAEDFNQAGIPAVEADSKTPTKERDKIMADFKAGRITVLCNVDLVSEGFNVPDCACAVLLRPTKSLVVYLQQSMRCMRYEPGKKAIIIDQVENANHFGRPDTDREWTLADRPKKKGAAKQQGPQIRTCPECFAVVPAQCKSCPECDYVFKAAVKKMTVDKKARLSIITKADGEQFAKKLSDCRTLKDYQSYAKAHHYKSGWAWYRWKNSHRYKFTGDLRHEFN